MIAPTTSFFLLTLWLLDLSAGSLPTPASMSYETERVIIVGYPANEAVAALTLTKCT